VIFCTFLKGQCHKIFDFRFFSWLNFLRAPSNLLWSFHFNSRCTTVVKDTGGAPENVFSLSSRLIYYDNIADTGTNLPTASLAPAANLPPTVSTGSK
jgi:hypothetical protein